MSYLEKTEARDKIVKAIQNFLKYHRVGTTSKPVCKPSEQAANSSEMLLLLNLPVEAILCQDIKTSIKPLPGDGVSAGSGHHNGVVPSIARKAWIGIHFKQELKETLLITFATSIRIVKPGRLPAVQKLRCPY